MFATERSSSQVLLIRHGLTGPNECGLVVGRSDPHLSEGGRDQAIRLARMMSRELATSIVCSPARRALETAMIVGLFTDLPIRIEERLLERGFGPWEGRAEDEMRRHLACLGPGWPDYRPPGGESFAEMSHRVLDCIHELVSMHGRWLVVTHAGPIRAVLLDRRGWAMHRAFELDVPHAMTVI